jgi:hypothetical protein
MHLQLQAVGADHRTLLWLLREASVPPRSSSGEYEREGSERVSKGTIATPSGGRWYCKLQVPITGEQGALLTIEHDESGGSLAPAQTTLVIPVGEADALVALLAGVIAQAKADGVLKGASANESGGAC